jgi:cytochrome c oxidase subunit 3/cytochrome o ubiquinol oxidase subunit 3
MSTGTITMPAAALESESVEQTAMTTFDRGRIAVVCLIVTETALFVIFVVAYLFYLGAPQSGPSPADVLELPVWATACLLSSSAAITMAERALERRHHAIFVGWLATTVALGGEFLRQTGLEWRRLIVVDHLTISTNVFGTTFYSLVGLHASHVIVGVLLLTLVLAIGLRGGTMLAETRRFQFLAWYWHFVDVIWIVVLSVVYVVGR